MNDHRRDLRQTASHIGRAALELKWTARDAEAAGHVEQAKEMRRVLEDMESLMQRLYEWAGELDVARST